MAKAERTREVNNTAPCLDDMNVNAPPWDYNPSSWRQRIPIAALAFVAFLIAGYMALYQWRIIDSAWDPLFGDQTMKVLDSDVSEKMKRWFGIPTLPSAPLPIWAMWSSVWRAAHEDGSFVPGS